MLLERALGAALDTGDLFFDDSYDSWTLIKGLSSSTTFMETISRDALLQDCQMRIQDGCRLLWITCVATVP